MGVCMNSGHFIVTTNLKTAVSTGEFGLGVECNFNGYSVLCVCCVPFAQLTLKTSFQAVHGHFQAANNIYPKLIIISLKFHSHSESHSVHGEVELMSFTCFPV